MAIYDFPAPMKFDRAVDRMTLHRQMKAVAGNVVVTTGGDVVRVEVEGELSEQQRSSLAAVVKAYTPQPEQPAEKK